MTLFKYKLNFKPEEYDFIIEDASIDFSTLLSQINSQHKRTDIEFILSNGSYICLDEEVEPYLDDETFLLFSRKITFSLYTNSCLSEMQSPTEIELDITLDINNIIETIKTQIKKNHQFNDFNISLYFSGGIPIEHDTLGYLLTRYHPNHHNLYAVLTPNINNKDFKTDLQVIQSFKLTQLSILNLLCFIQYIKNDGYKYVPFIQSAATIINFAPFFTMISKELSNTSSLISIDLVSMMLSLSHGIDPYVSYESVLEYLPNILHYICSLYSSQKPLYNSVKDHLVYAQDFSNSNISSFTLWSVPSESTLLSNNVDFHVFPKNSIILQSQPCFAKDGFLYIGKNNQTNIFQNPLTKEKLEVRFARTYYNYPYGSPIQINPSILKQIIVVLVDRSIHVKELNLERFEDQLLEYYTDQSNRYKKSTIHSMMVFNEFTRVTSKADTFTIDFHKKVKNIMVENRQARVMNAISDAVDYLNGFNCSNQNFQYPDAKLRIVLVTTGIDDNISSQNISTPDNSNNNQPSELNSRSNEEKQPTTIPLETSEKRANSEIALDNDLSSGRIDLHVEAKSENQLPTEAAQNPESKLVIPPITTNNYDTSKVILTYGDIKSKLYESDVILDSFIMNKEAESAKTIARLCHCSGGSCVVVNTDQTIKSTISQEAFLSYELRQHIPFGRNESSEFDTLFPNRFQIEAKKKTKLLTICPQLPKVSSNRSKRILEEFVYSKELTECQICSYMSQNNLNEWRVFIKAPLNSNLGGKWFYLLIEFPDEYPSKPPIFRFISIPYHANISDEGRICMNYLDKEYYPSLAVSYILMCIRELLDSPNYDDTIDLERANLHKSNPELFNQKVKESSANGKDTLEQWLEEFDL